jgi:DNA helicase IV
VINWQVDAAAPFYKASYANPNGVARLRKFETKRNVVVDFDETVLADLVRRVEELTANEQWGIDDAVLRDLGQDRTGEMQNIVQTIHAAQYELIRAPLDRLMVIQGGPGTGKTAVALHRVSWLLFNHRDELSADQVLVVGPNPTFSRYIKSVLPGLGDQDVDHKDLRSLGPQPSTGRAEDRDVARLKGDARMALLLATALQQRVRLPERTDNLQVGTGLAAPTLSRPEIEAAVARFQAQGSYSEGRSEFRGWLHQESRRQMRSSTAVTAATVEAAVERVWPSLTPQSFLRELLASRERLLAAAGDEFTAGDVGRLLRPAAERISEERWSDADVALLDECDALINGRGAAYAHVVVDEAQDLSPMQMRSIRRRSTAGSLTIVGDLAQSTGAWSRDSWADVADSLSIRHPVDIHELELGYRVPEQVTDFATKLLPYAAAGVTSPKVVRRGPADPHLIEVHAADLADRVVAAARDFAGRGMFVGIICPESHYPEVSQALVDHQVRYSDAGQGNLGASINLARPEEAKGLEFDAVVVVEPEAIAHGTTEGLRLLYVALTRTTRYLRIVHTGVPLPLPSKEPATTDEMTQHGAIADTAHTPGDYFRGGVHDTPMHDAGTSSDEPEVRTVRRSRARLSDQVAHTIAEDLADQIRHRAPAALWPAIVDRLRRELRVSGEEIFDLLD